MSNTNRWGLAAAGFLMQMALGAVYAWSVFRIPLTNSFTGLSRRCDAHLHHLRLLWSDLRFFRRPLAKQERPAHCRAHGGFLYGSWSLSSPAFLRTSSGGSI
jgi:OFA family oxalate/formate antiporter-like MFS transporter